MKGAGTILAALVLAAAACQENLSAPGSCPELCPGRQIPVFDTTITVNAGSDSSFFGYIPRNARFALLVSDGLPAAEARAFVAFPAIRTDSFSLDGSMHEFTVDTVVISFTLEARDSTATGLKLYLHRIPLTVDSTISFADLTAAIAAGPILDSIGVPDSIRTGRIEAFLTENELDRIQTPAADSGKISVGIRVGASKATGVRLALDPLGLSGQGPSLEARGKVDIEDTSRERQQVTVRATDANKLGYVFEEVVAANPDPNLLYLGGPRAGRTLLRFELPPLIRDSGQILRATLELTPAVPLLGLPGSRLGDSVLTRGIVVDLGAKSPALSNALSPIMAGAIAFGTSNPVSIDVLPLARQWQANEPPPQVILMSHNQEAIGFMQPVFYSTRSPTGSPRLRLTYAFPTRSVTP